MIFVDYLGPSGPFAEAREVIAREVGAALRMPSGQVAVRRVLTEDDGNATELWVELSSDEQLYRLGQEVAQRVSAALRATVPGDVWVMFRVVPRSHAFLNGEPRVRGGVNLD